MSTILGFIHPNTVSTGFMQSVLQNTMQLKGVIAERGGAGELGQARDRLVHKFLATNATHLWFVDTDIIFKPGALGKLLEHDKLVVSANYSLVHEIPATYDWETRPAAYAWSGEAPMMGLKPFDEYQGLMRVDACGAGCLLIHRAALEHLGEPWFLEFEGMGEDVSFCKRLWDNAIDLYYDADLKVLHQKTVWI